MKKKAGNRKGRSNSPLPYGRHWLDADDISAVTDVLRSDWLTTGPCVEKFEQALASYCGVRHAIAVSNGTAALHVAALAAGLGPGDRLLTTPLTFLASANCAEFVGASTDFVDVDPETSNLSPESLKRVQGSYRAVVAVDLAGRSCDMPRLAEIARKRGAVIIEDASHSLGGRFKSGGRYYRVGGHPWADMTTFSFHPVKTITSGEGGAIATNSDEFARRCRLFRNHGMIRNQEEFSGLGNAGLNEFGPWYYEMKQVGFNYRLTDFQCALAMSQLKKLPAFIRRRSEIVSCYNRAFSKLPLVSLTNRCGAREKPAWHLYVLKIDFERLGKTRTRVMEELRGFGVGSQVHYIPVHLQPYYRKKYGYRPGKCPVAEAYYSQCLSLPLYPAMTDSQVRRVIDAVTAVVKSNAVG